MAKESIFFYASWYSILIFVLLQNAQDGVHTLVLANKCDIGPEERDVSKEDIINVSFVVFRLELYRHTGSMLVIEVSVFPQSKILAEVRRF